MTRAALASTWVRLVECGWGEWELGGELGGGWGCEWGELEWDGARGGGCR